MPDATNQPFPWGQVLFFGLAGYFIGTQVERARCLQPLRSVDQVRSFLTPDQADQVGSLLDAGVTVVTKKIGNLVQLWADHGAGQLEQLFPPPPTGAVTIDVESSSTATADAAPDATSSMGRSARQVKPSVSMF